MLLGISKFAWLGVIGGICLFVNEAAFKYVDECTFR